MNESLRVLGLIALQFSAAATVGAADAVQPSQRSPAAPIAGAGKASETKPAAACSSYSACIALGKQLLDGQDPKQATLAFEKAITLAGQDGRKRADAYAYLGIAHEGTGDHVAALAYLERARATAAVEKGGWIDREYRRVLSAKPTMTAADIQRKLSLDKEIAEKEAPMQIAAAKPDETPESAPEDSKYNVEARMQTVVRGVGLDLAMAESNEKYAPSAAAPKKPAKPAPKAAAAKPKPRSAKPSYAAMPNQPSLDLRINFEFDSAVLTPDGIRQAEELGKALEQILKEDRQAAFLLLGHTDLTGSEQHNLSLSRDRAYSVKTFLTRNYPDLAGTLRAEGVGKRYPLFEGTDDESQKFNRRVEVKQLR